MNDGIILLSAFLLAMAGSFILGLQFTKTIQLPPIEGTVTITDCKIHDFTGLVFDNVKLIFDATTCKEKAGEDVGSQINMSEEIKGIVSMNDLVKRTGSHKVAS